MGAYLSKPRKEKMCETGESDSIRFAAVTMQGWRIHQEDAHNCIVDFGPDTSFFAVYDGHGGREVAQYLSKYFPEFLKQKELVGKQDIETELKKLFVDFDANLRNHEVVSIMGGLKEADLPKKPEEINDPEEAECKERESLIEEAVALSSEAKVSLDEIIRQYTRCRNKLIENAMAAEESRGSKRGVSFLSPQISKRRKINRENATDEDEPQNIDNGNKPNGNVNQEAPKTDLKVEEKEADSSEEAVKAQKVNGEELNIQEAADSTTGNNEAEASSTIAKPRHRRSVKGGKTSEEGNSVKDTQQSTGQSTNQKNEAEAQPSSSTSETQQTVDKTEDEDTDSDYNLEDEEEVTDEEEENETSAEDAEDEEEEEDMDDEDIGTLLNAAETGSKAGFDSGSTACIALIFKDRIVVANIGDSRAVLCRSGKAIELSSDHKPEDENEKKRIEAAGGKVGEDGRVNGGLNLSRAFGDHYYKQKENISLQDQMITALPDVLISERDKQNDEFLVIACDGIWNSMNSQQVCDFISERIGSSHPKDIAADICEHCCAKDTKGDGTGCDNETVILIDLKKDQRKISPKENHSTLECQQSDDDNCAASSSKEGE